MSGMAEPVDQVGGASGAIRTDLRRGQDVLSYTEGVFALRGRAFVYVVGKTRCAEENQICTPPAIPLDLALKQQLLATVVDRLRPT